MSKKTAQMQPSKTPKSDQLKALRERKYLAAKAKVMASPASIAERLEAARSVINTVIASGKPSPNASPNSSAYERNKRWRKNHPEAYASSQREYMRTKRAEKKANAGA